MERGEAIGCIRKDVARALEHRNRNIANMAWGEVKAAWLLGAIPFAEFAKLNDRMTKGGFLSPEAELKEGGAKA